MRWLSHRLGRDFPLAVNVDTARRPGAGRKAGLFGEELNISTPSRRPVTAIGRRRSDLYAPPGRFDSQSKPLKCVFESDLEDCPHYGGETKVVAATLSQPVFAMIPTHLAQALPLALQARASPPAPAGGPKLPAA